MTKRRNAGTSKPAKTPKKAAAKRLVEEALGVPDGIRNGKLDACRDPTDDLRSRCAAPQERCSLRASYVAAHAVLDRIAEWKERGNPTGAIGDEYGGERGNPSSVLGLLRYLSPLDEPDARQQVREVEERLKRLGIATEVRTVGPAKAATWYGATMQFGGLLYERCNEVLVDLRIEDIVVELLETIDVQGVRAHLDVEEAKALELAAQPNTPQVERAGPESHEHRERHCRGTDGRLLDAVRNILAGYDENEPRKLATVARTTVLSDGQVRDWSKRLQDAGYVCQGETSVPETCGFGGSGEGL